ncbi:MAG: M48 family metallopeptidase [Prolixibacteraceae bacterium]
MRKFTVVITILLFVACSTVPLTGRKQFTAIPTSQMLSLSNQSYDQVLQQVELSGNNQALRDIRQVGQKVTNAVERYLAMNDNSELIKGYEWEYNLIEDDALNAWCMPGGKIAFYTGILPVCEDKNGIAVVMAHEIAHAIARHGNERMSQQLALQLGGMALAEALEEKKETTVQLAMTAFGMGSQLGVILPYSRKHEKEADELGLYFMAMAGFDPREAPEFWKRMQAQATGPGTPEFLSTHPNPQKRIRYIERIMPEAMEYYNTTNR